jgi:hypothetical protein
LTKFILSVGDGAFKILASEAKRRDITIQQLLRAVIVPEWVSENLQANPFSIALRMNPPSIAPREIAPHMMRQSIYPRSTGPNTSDTR